MTLEVKYLGNRNTDLETRISELAKGFKLTVSEFSFESHGEWCAAVKLSEEVKATFKAELSRLSKHLNQEIFFGGLKV